MSSSPWPLGKRGPLKRAHGPLFVLEPMGKANSLPGVIPEAKRVRPNFTNWAANWELAHKGSQTFYRKPIYLSEVFFSTYVPPSGDFIRVLCTLNRVAYHHFR